MIVVYKIDNNFDDNNAKAATNKKQFGREREKRAFISLLRLYCMILNSLI